MSSITDGRIVFDEEDLAWAPENWGDTPWAVYVSGADEVVTHDMQGAGNGGEPDGDPFTEATARAYAAELHQRFGPCSDSDREFGNPLYALFLRYGVPFDADAGKTQVDQLAAIEVAEASRGLRRLELARGIARSLRPGTVPR